MICHLCLEEKKLINAHIIPKSFFIPLRSENIAPKIHSNTKGEYPQKTQTGIYDNSILCAECDGIIGVWDNYAQQLLLKDFTEKQAVYSGGNKAAYKIDDFDYHKLKLFFISVLWRASISNHKFYNRVILGPYEEEARNMILANEPGPEDDFAVVVAKFSDPEFKGMLDPHLDRYENINFYRFYMTGFVVYIKVDKRNTPEFMNRFKISNGYPLWIILRDLHESKDGDLFKKMARNKT
ncbi:hypothetical protein ACFL0B_04000 [Thermodesulfobacteriota bacterium]